MWGRGSLHWSPTPSSGSPSACLARPEQPSAPGEVAPAHHPCYSPQPEKIEEKITIKKGYK